MSKLQHLLTSKMSVGGKRKYGKLSLQKKIEIIKAAEMGFSQRALASRYNCGKTQIHLLVTQKAMWLDKWARSQDGRNSDDSHHFTEEEVSSYSNINDLVYDFYAKLSSSGIPISGSMLQERAIQVAKELHQLNFVADHDWLDTFVSHYEIALNSENDSSLTLLRSVGSRAKDDTFIQNYDLCDIYNLGEVRLAYKFVPSDSNPIKPSTTKDYLTVSLCFNAVGGKEAELIVYDSSQHGDVNYELPSHCVSNWKGMMTQSLYEKRLTLLNAEMARQSRQILMLVDESKYSGSLECTMSNIEVKPTSICLQSQPILCGVGHMFKFLYCRRLLRMLLAHLTLEVNVIELSEKLTLSKAVGLIQNAWDDLQPKTIENSLFEAGLKRFKSYSEDLNQISDSDEAVILEIKNLVGLVHKQENGEELSDDLFTYLIEENICSNSTSDCSDSEEESCTQILSANSHNRPQSEKAQPIFVINPTNFVDVPDVSSLVNDALPSISKLDRLSDVICKKNQLLRAKMLLRELGDIFEDAIADHKFKNAQENSK